MKGFRPKTRGEQGALEQYRPTAEAEAWTRYYREARALGKHWEGCMACPPERRNPKAILEVHHVIEQQRLKRWCRERGIAKGSLRELEILTDPRNSMLVDESCHWGHTGRGNPLPREAIRPYAWEFIKELGMVDEVLDDYPPRAEL